MTKLISVSVVALASCLALGGLPSDVAAQDRGWQDFGPGGGGGRDYRQRDRDRDDDRDARRRDRDDDDDRDRDRRSRGRDRDDDDDDDRRWRGRGWGSYDRGRNCYYVQRRYIERDGDVVIRRSRVCED